MIHRHLFVMQAEHPSGEREHPAKWNTASSATIFIEESPTGRGRPRKKIYGSFKTDKL
jgi:hypothetical protein